MLLAACCDRPCVPPVRRVYIPKPGQPQKRRPLGIPEVEDRLLQAAVSRLLQSRPVDMAERIGLVEDMDTHLQWDPKQCRVSPGTRLMALMVTFLVAPRALYRIPEFYMELDCAILFGVERQPDDFNDDAMGRA